ETLQLRSEVGHGSRIDQLAQLFGSQQLREQLTVEGQRLCPPFGERRVALVEKLADVVEEERGGERRCTLGVDHDDPDLARTDPRQQVPEAGEIEDVDQAFPI